MFGQYKLEIFYCRSSSIVYFYAGLAYSLIPIVVVVTVVSSNGFDSYQNVYTDRVKILFPAHTVIFIYDIYYLRVADTNFTNVKTERHLDVSTL